MLITFCLGVSSNLSQQKSPTAKFLRINFLQKIVLRKYMRKTSAIGLFCCHEFEETPKQKVINMSKLNKLHFSNFVNEWLRRWEGEFINSQNLVNVIYDCPRNHFTYLMFIWNFGESHFPLPCLHGLRTTSNFISPWGSAYTCFIFHKLHLWLSSFT